MDKNTSVFVVDKERYAKNESAEVRLMSFTLFFVPDLRANEVFPPGKTQ